MFYFFAPKLTKKLKKLRNSIPNKLLMQICLKKLGSKMTFVKKEEKKRIKTKKYKILCKDILLAVAASP